MPYIRSRAPIIGITGRAGSGKTTLAGILFSLLEGSYRIYHLADPIKQTVNGLFGWGAEHSNGSLKDVVDPDWGFSPRRAYQLFGTEFGRELKEDLWLRKADRMYEERGRLIVPDIRFDNEAEWVHSRGGIVVSILRDHEELAAGHVSEQGVSPELKDFVIYNTGTMRQLSQAAYTFLERFKLCS